jgi:2-keto-4-pentenoate hydratase
VTAAATDVLASVAREIEQARRDKRALVGLSAPIGEADAYRVQAMNARREVRSGARIVGFKVGLTSKAVQRQLGASAPDFGRLYSSAQRAGTIDLSDFIQPRIEAEMAFILGRDLVPDMEVEEAEACVAHACTAFEIVDSVFDEWKFDIGGAIADNGCAAAFVLGPDRVALSGIDRIGARMTVHCDDVLVSSGNGEATMGDPVRALVWLANEVARQGGRLRKGDLVLTGALGPMVPLEPGKHYRARIDGLGAVEIPTKAGTGS